VIEDPRVTVVVVSRNRRDELLETLGRHRARTVLVDNGSTDGTADAVRARHPDVEVVTLDRNLGAYARTLGARRAGTPFVAFADDDSWWAPGSLRAAADVLHAHRRVALVAARVLVGPTERLDPVCVEMAASPLRLEGLGPRLLGFVACGAMVRTDAFLAVGGFDRIVRFPGEEERVALDLTEAGWALVYRDDVVVHHHPSPQRHGPAARVRAITRASLLTAVLRLPARQVLARARAALLAGAPGRRALLDAARELVPAAGARRVTAPYVLADLALLAATDPTPPREVAPASSPGGGPS
jgi:GT2 family glycosyltransferase